MQCSSPPPLNDDQINAALDGDADPTVQAHLAECAGCAGRLAAARQFERQVRARLYRWDCPPPQQLADYHFGRVPPDDDRAIRRHLERCALCAAEVEDLRL